MWNDKFPTIQMLGRFQPWYEGHRLLFEKAILKTGQVNIQVKNVWKLETTLTALKMKKNFKH